MPTNFEDVPSVKADFQEVQSEVESNVGGKDVLAAIQETNRLMNELIAKGPAEVTVRTQQPAKANVEPPRPRPAQDVQRPAGNRNDTGNAAALTGRR